MKIVFIASRSIHDIGGIENYMKNLCPLLVESGHEVLLYSPSSKGYLQKYKGVEIVTVPSVNSKYFDKLILGAVSTLHALIFQSGVELFHYNANAAAVLSFLPRLLGYKVVYQGHGLEWKRNKWPAFYRLLIRALDYFVIKVNVNFTMVSEEQSAYIRSFGKTSTTITPGINIPKDNQEYSGVFDRFGIVSEKYVLFLGRLVQEKRPDVLIESFKKIDDKSLMLVIAGDNINDPAYVASLHNMAESDRRIIFTGAVYGTDKEALLSNCRLFCIPSELEGLPIALLEGMSYGKYCIASDIAANQEALGDAGIYFHVNDVDDLSERIVAGLLDDTGTVGARARMRVEERFTWPQIARKFDSFYRSLF